MKALLLSLALLLPALPLQAGISFWQYLLESANQGEGESQLVLGLAYKDGWEGKINTESTADKWRTLAVELGDLRPSLVLGLLQRENCRVKKDETEALKWLNLAARHGDDYARVILGEMLLEGDGVPADWRSGVEWIRLSASAGFAPAQYRLGVIYLIGDESTPKDEVEALAWFIVAAEAGSKPAQEYRDARTQLLGREVARLAIKRSLRLRAERQTASAGL